MGQIHMSYKHILESYTSQNLSQIAIKHCSKCSTKLQSLLLTNIVTAGKKKFQANCTTAYARGGVNETWIL